MGKIGGSIPGVGNLTQSISSTLGNAQSMVSNATSSLGDIGSKAGDLASKVAGGISDLTSGKTTGNILNGITSSGKLTSGISQATQASNDIIGKMTTTVSTTASKGQDTITKCMNCSGIGNMVNKAQSWASDTLGKAKSALVHTSDDTDIDISIDITVPSSDQFDLLNLQACASNMLNNICNDNGYIISELIGIDRVNIIDSSNDSVYNLDIAKLTNLTYIDASDYPEDLIKQIYLMNFIIEYQTLLTITEIINFFLQLCYLNDQFEDLSKIIDYLAYMFQDYVDGTRNVTIEQLENDIGHTQVQLIYKIKQLRQLYTEQIPYTLALIYAEKRANDLIDEYKSLITILQQRADDDLSEIESNDEEE